MSFPTLALGGTIKVPTLDGREEVHVPAGTQPGDALQAARQGHAATSSGRGHGDLHVIARVAVPKKLTKEQRHLLEELGTTLPHEKLDDESDARRSRSSIASKTSLAEYPALDLRYAPGPDTETLHDLLYAALDRLRARGHSGRTSPAASWRVFFRLRAQRDGALSALRDELGGRLLSLSPLEVDDEDWARRSQSALTAVRAGRIVVAPPWDVPQAEAGTAVPRSRADAGPGASERRDKASDIVIVIEPSMGFGTGHHATTRMCLELLQTVDLAGLRVVDVGTGSGVLAIAARRLGAAAVTALDNDPDALENARTNLDGDTHLYGKSLNFKGNLEYPPVSVVESDLSEIGHLRGDVVLANLTAAVLRRFAEALRGMVTDQGRLIVSGFGPGELDDVVTALGMAPLDVRHDGEWTAALLGYQPDGGSQDRPGHTDYAD